MTIREIKDGIAKMHGYPGWVDIDFRAIDEKWGVTRAPFAEERLWMELVKEYARRKVEEQRDLTAEFLAQNFNMRNISKPDLTE